MVGMNDARCPVLSFACVYVLILLILLLVLDILLALGFLDKHLSKYRIGANYH
jgi:hypothetical protein